MGRKTVLFLRQIADSIVVVSFMSFMIIASRSIDSHASLDQFLSPIHVPSESNEIRTTCSMQRAALLATNAQTLR